MDSMNMISEICTMSVQQLKNYISGKGMKYSDCVEKGDLIRRAHSAAATNNNDDDGRAKIEKKVDPLMKASTQQLKAMIVSAGLCPHGLTEKGDMVKVARDAKTRIDNRYKYQIGQGDAEALKEGQSVSSRYGYGGPGISTEILKRVGGRDAWMKIFSTFYRRLFADPRMNVLFGWRNVELETTEHGRRLGSFILDFNGVSDEYSRTPHDGFPHAHQKAKRCPMRPEKHQKHARFTYQQRDAWLGHMSLACDEADAPDSVKSAIMRFVLEGIHLYGPFIQE